MNKYSGIDKIAVGAVILAVVILAAFLLTLPPGTMWWQAFR